MYAKCFKRVIDFILSLLASPILLVLILLSTVFMRENPFWAQERPGKNEKIFKLVKFRIMDNRKDKDGKLLPDEIRLNEYSCLLRAPFWDKLLELVNILKEDSSIVGITKKKLDFTWGSLA